MELQRQNENVEAESLISSFSLNVATHHPDDVVATALYDQELAQRHERANQIIKDRQWKELYEDSGNGR
jgi:hypothetical protein